MGQAFTFFMGSHVYIIFISAIGGIIGAETRNSLSVVTLIKHQDFHHLSKVARKELSKFPFRRHRYLIGTVAAFVSIVSIGTDLPLLQQSVMGILVSLGGSSFLSNRMDGERIGEIDESLKRAVDEIIEKLQPATQGMVETASGSEDSKESISCEGGCTS